MSKVNEKYASEALLSEEARKKLGLVIKNGSVTTDKLKDGAVTPDKLEPGLWENIDSTNRETQEGLNRLQEWMNEFAGGLEITANTDSYEAGKSASVTITAKTKTGKKGDWVIRDSNNVTVYEKSDASQITYTQTIDKDTYYSIACKQGDQTATGQWAIIAAFPTWLGAGNSYTDIKTDAYKRVVGKKVEGRYEVTVASGQRIYLLTPKEVVISKVTMGGFEIPMNNVEEVTLAISGYGNKIYKVYESSNTYQEGTYQVSVNVSGSELVEHIEAIDRKIDNYPVADGEDIVAVTKTQPTEQQVLMLADKAYHPASFSGLGRKYLRKNIIPIEHEYRVFGGFVENVAIEPIGAAITDGNSSNVVYDRIRKSFLYREQKGSLTPAKYYDTWTSEEVPYSDYYQSSFTTGYTIRTDMVFMLGDVPYKWDGENLLVDDEIQEDGLMNLLTKDMINEPNTIYHIQYDYDLNDPEHKHPITIPEGSTLKFEGGSFTNGTLVLDESIQMLNPKLSGISLKGTNTALTTDEINILELYPDYFTYEDNYIYGLPKAINDFMQSINSIVQRGRKMDGETNMTSQQPTLPGITIKVPAGCYVINETINLEGSVSLKGCAGTEFWLDFGEGNEGVGICVGPNKYATRQYHEGLCETELCNFGMYSLWTNNQYTGILDTHATHEIHHLNFGGTLKRWITGRKLFNSGYLDYYGDGRSIHDIHGNAADWEDDYKMMFGAGDGQSLSKLVGHFKVVLVTGNFSIKDTVCVEFVLIDCNNVSMTNCYSEVNGVQCYNSKLSMKGCTLGTPEHGNYTILYDSTIDSDYNKGKLYRDHFTNNLEIDTPRILQAALAVGIVGLNDHNGQDTISFSALRSVVSLENVVFLGLGFRSDNKDGSGVSVDRAAATDVNEFNYIYRNSSSSGYIRYLGGVTCRKDYNNGPDVMYPLPERYVTHVNLPTGSIVSNLLTAPDKSDDRTEDELNNFLHVVDSASYINNGVATNAIAYTDLEAGTYYYRVAVAANLRSRIGNVASKEVSITYKHDSNDSSRPCLIEKALELNCVITKNQTIVLWRYQKDSNDNIINRKYCYFQIPEDGLGRTNCKITAETPVGSTKYLIKGDSEYMINGFKWISDPNDAFKISDFKNKTIVQRVEKISENNYRYVGAEGKALDEVKVIYGEIGDEVAVRSAVENTETLYKAYKKVGGSLAYVQITNPGNSNISRIPMTKEFEGTGVYDPSLGKIVYLNKINGQYVWTNADEHLSE